MLRGLQSYVQLSCDAGLGRPPESLFDAALSATVGPQSLDGVSSTFDPELLEQETDMSADRHGRQRRGARRSRPWMPLGQQLSDLPLAWCEHYRPIGQHQPASRAATDPSTRYGTSDRETAGSPACAARSVAASRSPLISFSRYPERRAERVHDVLGTIRGAQDDDQRPGRRPGDPPDGEADRPRGARAR